MHKIKYVLLITLSFLLIACQTNKVKNNTSIQQQWHVHQQDLKQVTAFQVNGSIAYFGDNSRNYGRFLIMQQAVNNYEIKITTPVGTNILTLKANNNYAELIDKNGKSYTDKNVEDLMRKISNINIPLDSLHNWLKGFSDDMNTDKLDNSGRLVATEFMQNNNRWNLKINNYMTRSYKNKNIDLPALIELTHGDQRVRLKIDNWVLR
ncbi:lipoprotein insertase outer membrane protein LolB [Gilliamella sp. wkB112]|uniref:lipoprotein insertase outer membrane protein LolB n=1 Tax=Gilliamella sp. wkB112 TaxID=3120257 RepID=UPI00080E22ED|nr:lipoprotein insertase outer membrane protein LolB [Gilliamella apicola]OCG00827.1 outer membrane lipoprotein LolB [Gilliamella apicola]